MQITPLPARQALAGAAGFPMPLEATRPGPRLRTAGGWWRGRLAGATLFACVLAGMAGVVSQLASRGAADRAVSPAVAAETPKPVWVDVNRPIHLFELSGSEFSRLPLDYRARRREPGGERQDVLTYGAFGRDRPFLALALLRRGEAVAPAGDFFVSLVRVAGEAGLSITRNALPTLLPSRFGPFATADVTLSGPSAGLPCLAFRLQASDPGGPIDIAGLACRPSGMDRAQLACVLDRIDLMSAGEDDALRAFFVEAERRREESSCTAAPLLAAGLRLPGREAGAAPPSTRHLPGSRIR